MKNYSSKFKINSKLLLIVFIFSFFIFHFGEANAAKFTLSLSDFNEIVIGRQFKVNLFLDSESSSINAVEGKINFPENIGLYSVSDGGSIISFWAEKPKIGGNEISFAGVVPGGYNGSNGLVFSAVFTPKAAGSSVIKIINVKALLNDGQGTPAPVSVSNLPVKVASYNLTSEKLQVEVKDSEKPETFSLQVTRDESMFDGKWFLVFTTQDKGSGIDRYEIKESDKKQKKGEWKTAESPYLLSDQKLYSYIYVKAVDKAGNERVVMLEPAFAPWYKRPLVDIIVGLGIIIVVLFSIWLWQRFLKKKH